MIILALLIVGLGVYAWFAIGQQTRIEAKRERTRLARSIAALELELADHTLAPLTNYTTVVRNPYQHKRAIEEEFFWGPGAIWEVEDHAAVRALSTV